MVAPEKVYIGGENEERADNYRNLADASLEGVFLLGGCGGLKRVNGSSEESIYRERKRRG